MNRQLTTIILTFFLLTSYSQTEAIFGFVYDGQTNNRLAFANVYLVQKNKLTQSDKKGVFKFVDLPNGLYTLKCALVGNGDTTINNIQVGNIILDTIKINLQTCPGMTLGGEIQCPICKKTDMTIPIKYGKPSRQDIAKSKKGQLYLLDKPSHCDPRHFCLRDSTIYN